MKLSKVLAAFAASAVAVSAMAITASAASIENGQAIIGFGDVDWKVGGWAKPGNTDDVLSNDYFTIADVTGNGTYTVAVDVSAGYTNEAYLDEETGEPYDMFTANGIGAMGINLNLDPEDEQYDNVICTITAVSFDGVDFPVTGVSYTNSEDGMKRTNVYNAWAGFDAAKEDHVSTDPANATGSVIDISSLSEWSKCEITFEVTGMPEVDPPAPEVVPEDTTTVVDGTDNSAPETGTGDTNAATDASKGNADTGIEGVAVVAGLALVAAGAVIVSKKRK